MKLKLILLAVLALFTSRAFSQVTCYAITPATSGTGAGSSWTNAHGGIPALVRGTRYYFADGSYAGFTFSSAASGTTIIEFRKAQTYDFGRSADGCSNDISAGWNPATMGAGQAVFSRTINITGPYFVFNGNGTLPAAGCGGAPASTVTGLPPTIIDCGFAINDTTCASNCARVVQYSTGPLTFEYIELRGNSTPSANEDNFVQGSGTNPSTWSHIYGHDTGAVYLQYGCNQQLVDHSYFWGTERQGPTADGTHGQAMYCGLGENNANTTYSNNVFRDITGTAVVTFGSNSSPKTHDNWLFYNNVFMNSTTFTGASLSFGWVSDGLIACINSETCTNFKFNQNTIINTGDNSHIELESTAGAANTVISYQNNLIYGVQFGTTSNNGTGTFTGVNNNSYLNSPCGDTNAGHVCVTSGSPNPFVAWTTYNSAGFNLASDNANWNNRASLAAPFTTDFNGVTFTTDRGAYQFTSGTASFNGAPAVIPAHHSNNITVTLTGVSTTWNGSTAFSISGVTGATLTGHSNISATSETLTITTGTGTGTLTITDTTDSISTTISVSTATLSIAPSAGNVSTTPTLTLTGSNTLWLSETAAGLFTVTGGTGSSIATPTVTSNTSATAVLTTGSVQGNETITDTSTTATAVFTVAVPTAPTVTTGTAFNETASGTGISANSYVCTGSCFGVTAVGTCYALTSNPTTPCTSDGTGTPFSSTITGLLPSTTYHYRAFATNGAGTSYGADQTFTTQPAGITFLQFLPSGSCSTAVTETGSSSTWTAPCTPFAVGDAVVMFAQCHPTSGVITGITLTAPGWTITQLVPPATTGSNSWGSVFGAIVPNTSPTTFTATFTGGANCSNFGVFLSGEFAGNDPTGGATTFNASGSASGASGTCTQTAANITPPLNNEGVWAACLLGTATTATAPWTIAATDGTGDTSEYQILVNSGGVAQTPAFNGSSGAFIVQGVAIAPLPIRIETPQLPLIWVNNNEGNTTTYELKLGASSWITGPPPTCTFTIPYAVSTAGLQSAINAIEACRTLNGSGIALDIPPGLYTTAAVPGIIIPQSNTTTSSSFLILRSTFDNLLPNGQTVCAHGIQDNLLTSVDIGLINPDCAGDALAYQLGTTVTTIPAGPFTLANGVATNTSAYNDVQYMWTAECSSNNCQALSLCSPIGTSGVSIPPKCTGTTIGPDHWLIEDMEARPSVGNTGGSIVVSTPIKGTETSLSQFATHIHFRKDWAHGDWTSLTTGSNSIDDGFDFAGCVYCSLVDSQVSQALRPGAEGHSMLANGITYKINHNWLEGSSSGIFTGGFGSAAGPSVSGFVPWQDAEVRRNRLTFPYSWLGQLVIAQANPYWGSAMSQVNTSGTAVTWVSGDTFSTLWAIRAIKINSVSYQIASIPSSTSIILTTSAGTQTNVPFVMPTNNIARKNAEENKEGERVLFDGDIIENSDSSGGESGNAIVLTPRNTSAASFGTNYQSTMNDYTFTNDIIRNACDGIEINSRSTGVIGSGGGVSMPMRNFLFSNIAAYNIGLGGAGCAVTGISDLAMVISSPAQRWQGTVTENAAGTAATFVATCSIAGGDCPTGPPSAGFQVTDLSIGDPVWIAGCTLVTAFNNSPTQSIGGIVVPTGIGPLAISPTSPSSLSVTFPLATTPNAVDNSNNCILSNVQGSPSNLLITHFTFINNSHITTPASNGANPGPQFMPNSLLRDSIFLTGGTTWNANAVAEGTATEKWSYDNTTMSADHMVFPTRTASTYTEYGNNPSFPDLAGCTGSGCNPPTTMYFPATDYCTGATPDATCIGFIGAMSAVSMPLTLPDYHQFALLPTSVFASGGVSQASDGTAMGANISAIDAAQTQTLYVCGSPCGSGPFPDATFPRVAPVNSVILSKLFRRHYDQ